MLMRSFLTPEELNISDKQFNALVQVLGMLERGELPWHCKNLIKPTDIGFNMDRWYESEIMPECGSVGCLGYWCNKLGGHVSRFAVKNSELEHLFYPNRNSDGSKSKLPKFYEDITPDEATQALRNYLGTGKADWAGVLA